MPSRSSSEICERSLDLTLIGIGRRIIPQCAQKHFFREAFYKTSSGGRKPRSPAARSCAFADGRCLTVVACSDRGRKRAPGRGTELAVEGLVLLYDMNRELRPL